MKCPDAKSSADLVRQDQVSLQHARRSSTDGAAKRVSTASEGGWLLPPGNRSLSAEFPDDDSLKLIITGKYIRRRLLVIHRGCHCLLREAEHGFLMELYEARCQTDGGYLYHADGKESDGDECYARKLASRLRAALVDTDDSVVLTAVNSYQLAYSQDQVCVLPAALELRKRTRRPKRTG